MELPIKRALISVSDKSGVVEFVRQLHNKGIDILSTGGTAALLRKHDISVTEISDYTHFPEIMDGRVKTLHPRIYGGILGRRSLDDAVMAQHEIQPIDLVVVNLYPFTQVAADPNAMLTTIIENIDIGGPAMLRAAAKNYESVTVISDSADYDRILTEMNQNNNIVSATTRFDLAIKGFAHTANYDAVISNYLGSLNRKEEEKLVDLPSCYTIQLKKKQDLRYGENPHQRAGFYIESSLAKGIIASAQQLQGKELSFNNITDTDTALECVKSFNDQPTCVIVKHANPCGVATGSSLKEAYERAYHADPVSAFGGIIAFNQSLDGDTARTITEQQFVEVIIAPTVEESAQRVLAAKSNIRILASGNWSHQSISLDFKRVMGGLLIQNQDIVSISLENCHTVTNRIPTPNEVKDLLFAWKVVKFVKSNAIVYAKEGQTIGIGAGQTSRVMSSQIAGLKAKESGFTISGSILASDAFFPFRDGLDTAAELGIRAVIQPGGSKRDDEVIAAANEHDIAMIFTGIRHFRH
ncbi:bifunctional phosphoribosylaminoimidazolecarboxamide formyltransferase/IMP cyclohydrolase [Candidatus Nitrosacidococcus tergens]|uniref:Bifunctional purine biosynthesis protein PurH n=1 Tax=Candidatus Nitrosacidococcus tergens TaxID=553981 RepID=A0A7G1QBR2_9GAMM|nr:bifunctional phosphoribosylaminoimidazolecarboxamide formyltransferase/IMP cyclohydrolase [Candidatus Nitrosacidococcus tergens]CAB1277200.1 fused IMP cyclohydrolase; phosphoribosylaminoimidazolecarboxamide formyltransferase [Candidatus Nitrosacidococcus tergens]